LINPSEKVSTGMFAKPLFKVFVCKLLAKEFRHARNMAGNDVPCEKKYCRECLPAKMQLLKTKAFAPLGEIASCELIRSRLSLKETHAREYYHEGHGLIFPLYRPGYIVRGNHSIVLSEGFFRLKKLVINQK